MYYTYILQSLAYPTQFYVGFTSDLHERLFQHNDGKCSHTSKYLPWKVITYTAFETKEKAISFEKYLKSGSGRAFRKRHF
jgi:predicted GIY-YIG superfamily endonuclease